MKNFLKNKSFYSVFFSVILSVLLVSGAAGAATTISANINTGGTLTVSGASTLAAVTTSGVVTLSDQITLQSATSDPAGVAAGSLYYDSTNDRVRLYKGNSTWTTLASSTDANGGLTITNSKGIRFNTIASGYALFGTTTQSTKNAGAEILTLVATTSASVPLLILGPTGGGGTGNLLEIAENDTIVFVTVSSAGLFSLNANTTIGDAAADVLTINANASTTASFSIGFANDGDANLYVGSNATTSGATGNFVTEGTIEAKGNASSTSLNVGGNGSQTTITGLVAGFCNLDESDWVLTASSTGIFGCTDPNGLVVSGDRVLVMATSTAPDVGDSDSPNLHFYKNFAVIAATASTTVGVIDVTITNLDHTATTTIGPQSFNFWAFRF